ncbi:MAG: hypothetical protein JWQ71_2865 [Pedosphaera sp.]|nr:hypothetical protein [Pedosphaera sp.]
MGAEEIGFSQGGEDGKEWFGAADFVAEIFEGVGQGVTGREAEFAEAEGVQKSGHLVTDADGAVLQVAIVKTEAGIDEDFFDAVADGDFNLAREIFFHHGGGIGV